LLKFINWIGNSLNASKQLNKVIGRVIGIPGCETMQLLSDGSMRSADDVSIDGEWVIVTCCPDAFAAPCVTMMAWTCGVFPIYPSGQDQGGNYAGGRIRRGRCAREGDSRASCASSFAGGSY
jgi:hypothetical protein